MSTEKWKIEHGLCRCCHSEGNFKNLAEPCKTSGVTEIYSDMLKDCFDMDLTPVPGMLCAITYTICDHCISRLRDASDFKKQVQACEDRFRDMYNKNVIKGTDSDENLSIKEEMSEGLDDDFKEDFVPDDDDDYEEPHYKCEDEADFDREEGSRQKKKPKKSNLKLKPCRTVKQKKVKHETAAEDSGNKKGKMVPTKFRLREDEDFKRDGEGYQCARCDKKYDKIFSLRFHVKTKHYKIPRYTCPICQEGFHTPAPWTVHKLKAHNIDDRFNCNACKGTFNTKVQLRKHINNFHMLGERYKCEFCDYESFSFEGMYKHKFKHRTSKDFHCKFCRKAFLRKTTLDLHERIHTGDRRKVCTVCGQAFVQKASLNYHMTKYHPEVNF